MGVRSRGIRVAGTVGALCVALVAAAVGALPGTDSWDLRSRSAATSAADRAGAEGRGQGGTEARDAAGSATVSDTGRSTDGDTGGGAEGGSVGGAPAGTGTAGSVATTSTTASGGSTSTTVRPGVAAGRGLSNVAACAAEAIRPRPSTPPTTAGSGVEDELDCPVDFSCLTEILGALRDSTAAPNPAAFASLHECIAQIVRDLIALIRGAVADGTNGTGDPVPPTAPAAAACVRSVFQSWMAGSAARPDPSDVVAELRRCLAAAGAGGG